MGSAGVEINRWYDTLKEQALERNEKSVATWSKYKEDLLTTKSLLSTLPKKVKHDVMVPIGSKALMPGKLVHTNEFLVNLGETWFAKRTASQTIDICDRRVKVCEEMLEKLQKERELVVNKSTLPAEQEAFGNEERPEIIEYVTEEENEEWKKQHRVREKKYRQELAELRNREKKPIETEEDLWKHLDKLELQEELEDELNRLNAEYSSEEDVPEEDLESSLSVNQNKTLENENLKAEEDASNTDNVKNGTAKTKRKVSFACDLESSDDEPLRLEFKHSDCEPAPSDPESKEIISPSDIYKRYLHLSTRSPLCVLKSQVNPNQKKELEFIHSVETSSESDDDQTQPLEEKIIPTGIQLNDVIERRPVFSSVDSDKKLEEKTRKVSKFKANRKKSAE